MVLAAGLTPLPRDALWRNAVLRPPLESLAKTARAFLPAKLAQRIQLSSDPTERRVKQQSRVYTLTVQLASQSRRAG
jgi:hypothetical protein